VWLVTGAACEEIISQSKPDLQGTPTNVKSRREEHKRRREEMNDRSFVEVRCNYFANPWQVGKQKKKDVYAVSCP